MLPSRVFLTIATTCALLLLLPSGQVGAFVDPAAPSEADLVAAVDDAIVPVQDDVVAAFLGAVALLEDQGVMTESASSISGPDPDELPDQPSAPTVDPEGVLADAESEAQARADAADGVLVGLGVEQSGEEARGEADGALVGIRGTADDVASQIDVDFLLSTAGETVRGFAPEVGPLLPDEFVGSSNHDDRDGPSVSTTASTGAWGLDADSLAIAAGTAAAAGLIFWIAGSSGTLGGASAGTAAAQQAANRKFVPFASPLFTRFEKDTVLDHPKREGLYGMIVVKPGITLQDLCEGTGLSRTAVSHHLRLMEQQHLIVSKRVGRSRHFFENGGRYGRDQKEAYAVLHNERSAEVHSFIEGNPGSIQKDLCEALGIQASVVHWHVKRLLEASLIEAVRQGRTVSYFPTQAVRGVMS